MNKKRLSRWYRLLGQRLRLRLAASIRLSASYSRANMRMFAMFELLGQPIYYLLWVFVYPEAYENLELRIVCMLLAVPMLFERQIGSRAEKLLTTYWIGFLLFELPFFFVFMSLMNNLSPLWAISTMSAVMIMVIVTYDWLMSLLLAITGTLVAWLVFIVIGGTIVDPVMGPGKLFWLYMFGLAAGSAFNYQTELVAREKLSAITDAVGTMAHELRTPLLGIRSGARGLNNYLPSLIAGYRQAVDANLDVPRIRRAHLEQISSVLQRIESETEYTGVVLDMLLVNSNRTAIDTQAFEQVTVGDCVEDALARYPFHSLAERNQVHHESGSGFVFRGSRILMVHVLFNLMKNALYQIAHAQRGKISIWWDTPIDADMNILHFRDTGPGIEPAVLPFIFDRFYSGMPRGQGTGIGLAFVKVVIESFGGQIRCHSIEGHYTEFVIRLPKLGKYEPI